MVGSCASVEGSKSFLILLPVLLTTSQRPPLFVAITGCPHAVASIATRPKGSSLDGTNETSEAF